MTEPRVRALDEIHAEPPVRYAPDRHRGTWQEPRIPHADIARIRAAASLAATVLPPALGKLVHDDLADWCDAHIRFGGHGQRVQVAAELEAIHRDRTVGGG